MRPDGKLVAAAGGDGAAGCWKERPVSGAVEKSFEPAASGGAGRRRAAPYGRHAVHGRDRREGDLPSGDHVIELEVKPEKVDLHSPFDYAQLVVTARLDTGESIDVTRMVVRRSPSTSPPSPPRVGPPQGRRPGAL